MSSTMLALQEVFRDVFGKPQLVIGPETSAADIEEWDSLTHVQLIMSIESKFGITVPLDAMATVKSAGDFARLIDDVLRKRA